MQWEDGVGGEGGRGEEGDAVSCITAVGRINHAKTMEEGLTSSAGIYFG